MLSMLSATNSKLSSTEEELAEKGALIDRYYHDVEKEAMRRCILDEGKRLDGRKTNEIRPIWCEVESIAGTSRISYLHPW